MIRRTHISILTDTRFPYTTLFRAPGYHRRCGSTPGSAPTADPPRPPGRLRGTGHTSGRRSDGRCRAGPACVWRAGATRSEEHTSELQSLMRNSYAVFCLKKKNNKKTDANKM